MINKTVIVAIRNADNEFFASTSKTQIANFLNISVGTVHRVLIGTTYYSCNAYQIKTGVPLGTMNRHGVVHNTHTKTLVQEPTVILPNDLTIAHVVDNVILVNNNSIDTDVIIPIDAIDPYAVFDSYVGTDVADDDTDTGRPVHEDVF